MRLTHIAPSAKLAALFSGERSGRAPLPISQAGPILAVPAHADPAHAVPPPDDAPAAVEFLLQRPRAGHQHAEMASLAGGRQRWADLVGRLLPGTSPDQQRLRGAMLAVDRACFVEPSTPEALVYEVWLAARLQTVPKRVACSIGTRLQDKTKLEHVSTPGSEHVKRICLAVPEVSHLWGFAAWGTLMAIEQFADCLC